jgi:hypothetical protein
MFVQRGFTEHVAFEGRISRIGRGFTVHQSLGIRGPLFVPTFPTVVLSLWFSLSADLNLFTGKIICLFELDYEGCDAV